MKVLSWNINGLRSFKTDIKELLSGLDADIICFQETKVTRDMLEEPLAIVEGFSSYFSFSRKRSGYSGVATFCSHRATPIAAQEGLSGLLVGELSDGCGTTTALAGKWSQEQLKDLDSEGRAVITQHRFKDTSGVVKDVCIINVYCPRVDPEKPERRTFKLRFYELIRQRATAIKASGMQVIVLGDINTSHRRIDHCDPDDSEEFEKRLDRRYLDQFLLRLDTLKGVEHEDGNSRDGKTDMVGRKNVMNILNDATNNDVYQHELLNISNENIGSLELDNEYSADEELLTSVTDFQMVDTFRYFHPEKTDAFSCWNTFISARATNYGTRIDYVLCDREFLHNVTDSLVLQDVMGSDHCPVAIIVSGELLPAPSLPDTCTKFFPEFRGQQQKLLAYFQPKSALPNDQANKFPMTSRVSRVGNLSGKLQQNSSKRKPANTKTKSQTSKKACVEKQTKLSTFFTSRTSDQKSVLETEEVDKTVEINSPDSPVLSSSQQSSESSDNLNSNTQESSEDLLKEDSVLKKENSNSSTCSSNGNTISRNQKQNSGWGFMMKTPAPPPLCKGHQEPCLLLTVKKKGPNLNRQFYACARGVGREGDPNARCNFFKILVSSEGRPGVTCLPRPPPVSHSDRSQPGPSCSTGAVCAGAHVGYAISGHQRLEVVGTGAGQLRCGGRGERSELPRRLLS
ncbi:hypothetical protein Pmani_024908 [Petrolisthes manimaculis]|uniref:DNA-(apurinic or apyrimidinic site) endonuclease 2 n=1 Tax=Petrolisthes manimaculis TaxID=1843537 RepID=A0AAE1TYV8_9EUCA|nr:hypothetical protein Pmani_024908 [Petrolisthes manimaculis]